MFDLNIFNPCRNDAKPLWYIYTYLKNPPCTVASFSLPNLLKCTCMKNMGGFEKKSEKNGWYKKYW